MNASADRWAGIGWRQPHYRALMAQQPALGFIEVHSENFFGDGGAALAVLEQGRAHYPVSLHGVGLALGSAIGLDPDHLDQLARLVERIEPVRVSDHASFARVPAPHGVQHASDLLPVAFDTASLDILAANVQRVQERLRRPLLVENLSAYVQPPPQGEVEALSEPAFFNALTRRTGCGLLLDVNNLVVNALNAHGFDDDAAVAEACAWIDAIDPASVGEIHLAGYCRTAELVIDDHGSRVHSPVWAVFRHALARLGPRPTLIEWDTEVPDLAVLLDEAACAEACLAQAAGRPSLTRAQAIVRPAGGGASAVEVASAQRRLVAAIHEGAPHRAALGEITPRTEQGLAAYRRNAAALAERALGAAYPTVQQLIGPEAFAGLARALWRAHPPHLGDMGCWGEALAGFLVTQSPWPALPYLADVARLEWAVHRAGFAADAPVSVEGLSLLGSGEPEQLWLQWAPGSGSLCSRWPVATLWQAHRRHAPDRFDAVREAFDHQRGEHVWWWRQGWPVHVTALDPATAAFHAAIDRGLPLGEALTQVLHAHPDFSFAQWLQTALLNGWLSAVTPRPPIRSTALTRAETHHEETLS